MWMVWERGGREKFEWREEGKCERGRGGGAVKRGRGYVSGVRESEIWLHFMWPLEGR